MAQKHLTLNDIAPDNYRYLVEKPDQSFSPERNYAVIRSVIAENDKMQLSVDPRVKANAGNIADILSSFAKYKLDIGGGKQVEQWLGKNWMGKIYGEKLLEKIRIMESVQRLNREKGNTMLGGNFYLK